MLDHLPIQGCPIQAPMSSGEVKAAQSRSTDVSKVRDMMKTPSAPFGAARPHLDAAFRQPHNDIFI